MRSVTLEEVREDEPLRRQLRAARRVVCVVGAGLSTSSGIPDFRSAGGLYEHVKNKYSVRNGADLFDANLFRVPVSVSTPKGGAHADGLVLWGVRARTHRGRTRPRCSTSLSASCTS